MPYYKDQKYLVHNTHEAFEKIHSPAEKTPYSGIYRCEGCGEEVISTEGHPLPPQNHHQHTQAQGKIR